MALRSATWTPSVSSCSSAALRSTPGGPLCSTPRSSAWSPSEVPPTRSPDFVPAVFPFPEPIPQGPPRRWPLTARATSRAHSALYSGASSSASDAPENRSLKYTCAEMSFVSENKQRANGWISECAPKTWVLEQERPVWLQQKHELERKRRARNNMYRNLPTMPFDLWFETKQRQEAAAEASAEAEAEQKRQQQTQVSSRKSKFSRWSPLTPEEEL